MKKPTLVLMRSLALASVLVVRASAVWVPSTSLQEAKCRPTDEQLQRAARKLHEDERRLEEALQELKKDQAELRRLLGEEERGNPMDNGVGRENGGGSVK